jgi:hypothetical protein
MDEVAATSNPDHPGPARAYTLTEINKMTKVGMTSIYKAINSGQLKAKKQGVRTLVLAEDFDSWIKNWPAYTPNPRAA